MCLFGDFSDEKPKKSLTLIEMVELSFGDDKDVVKALLDYLASRKQQHNMPSKIAWEKQLEMLKQVQPQDRATMINNSTMKGYRQIVYLDSYKPSSSTGVSRVKTTGQRSSQSF